MRGEEGGCPFEWLFLVLYSHYSFMHKKLWCSSVFTVFWVLITLWWPLGSSAPLVRYLPSRSNLVITPWCTPLQPPILQYHNIILFCCLSVRPRQRLTNNWTKFWQFICSYLFLCQCCCQLFYFWSASVNSSFMARQQPAVELETKVHPKVRNHGEGPY